MGTFMVLGAFHEVPEVCYSSNAKSRLILDDTFKFLKRTEWYELVWNIWAVMWVFLELNIKYS